MTLRRRTDLIVFLLFFLFIVIIAFFHRYLDLLLVRLKTFQVDIFVFLTSLVFIGLDRLIEETDGLFHRTAVVVNDRNIRDVHRGRRADIRRIGHNTDLDLTITSRDGMSNEFASRFTYIWISCSAPSLVVFFLLFSSVAAESDSTRNDRSRAMNTVRLIESRGMNT